MVAAGGRAAYPGLVRAGMSKRGNPLSHSKQSAAHCDVAAANVCPLGHSTRQHMLAANEHLAAGGASSSSSAEKPNLFLVVSSK